MEKIKCLNCGNEKDFYVECLIPCKIRYNSKTRETYGKVYDIWKEQYTEFELVYCKKCGQEVEIPEIE